MATAVGSERVRPRRPWLTWLLSVLIPSVYWWYWYWQLVRDLRDTTRASGRAKRPPNPTSALLMASVGALLVVPLVLTLIGTARVIRRLQQKVGVDRRCRSWIAPTVMLVGSVVVLIAPAFSGTAAIAVFLCGLAVTYLPVGYLQYHANSVLAVTKRPSGVRLAVLGGAAVLWACVVLPIAAVGGAGLLKPFKMPAGSMEPTFRCGDRFLVESLTNRSTNPRRGDIVTLHPPAGAETTGAPASAPTDRGGGDPTPADVTYVKRIIALPGETVSVRNHRAVVEGDELDEPYITVSEASSGGYGDLAEITVPDDAYFVLGDHRDNSADSRVFGPVPQSFIVGRAVWLYWPPARFGPPPTDPDRSYADDVPDPACDAALAP